MADPTCAGEGTANASRAAVRFPHRPSDRLRALKTGGNSPVGSTGCRCTPTLGTFMASATWYPAEPATLRSRTSAPCSAARTMPSATCLLYSANMASLAAGGTRAPPLPAGIRGSGSPGMARCSRPAPVTSAACGWWQAIATS
ncbi:hypothetical protein ACFQYP_12115 [Nonomuraea antimicrobica]